MRINIVGAFIRNAPFGTEIAFRKGLERIGGHQLTIIDPSYPDQRFDYGADATIVFKTGGQYSDELLKCGGKRVVYQPDDMRFPHIQQMMHEMLQYCDYALTFDKDGAQMAVEFGYKAAQRLIVTADDELYHNVPGMKKDIDFCFVGSLTGGQSHASRRRMVEVLTQNGFKVLAVSDLYNIPAIVNIYNRSRVVLNHATDVGQPFGQGFGYQCRHFEAGFTGACILSNLVTNEDALDGFVATFDDEESLLERASYLSGDGKKEASWLGETLYYELQNKHMPEHRALEIVDFLGSLP